MTIEVTISAEPRGGLKLIDKIPAHRPCRLEGRNGIGKTATIKLLSLAVGEQPYADDPAAWESLRRLLPDGATVTFAGLAGDLTANLTLTPSMWPEQPYADIGNLLGNLTVNGEPRPASELATLVTIHHLSGTERLIDTLKGRITEYETSLSVVHSRLKSLTATREEVGELADRLEYISPKHDESERDLVATLSTSRDRNRAQAIEVRRRLTTVHRGLSLHAMLQDSDFQEHARTLADSIATAERARAEAKDLDVLIEGILAELDSGDKAQRLLASAERKLNALIRKRNARMARLHTLSQQLAAHDLPLTTEKGTLDSALVSQMAEEARAKCRQLEWRHRQSQMSDAQRRLHNELSVALDLAMESGLAQFSIVVVNDVEVTVEELARALTDPASTTATTPEDVDVAQDLASLLEEAATLLREQEAFVAAYDEEEQRVAQLREDTPEQDDLRVRLADTMSRRDAAESEALFATQIIGRLQARGVTKDGADAADAELTEILSGEDLEDAAELQPRTMDLTAELSHLDAQIDQAIAELSEVERRQASRQLRRREMQLAVTSEPSLAWLRTPGDESTPGDPADNPTWWLTAAERAHLFAERLDRLVTEVAALEFAASTDKAPSAHRRAIESVVEQDALADFAEPAIRDALFDGGEALSVDLQRKTIAWSSLSGARQEKPLSTFSSGQQALGFIRARLRQLADQKAGDRIVFLDEFGAFVAADRRHPLAELLKRDQLAALSDQVVIVLPLQVDYGAQLDDVTGPLKERYAARAASINAHGYFTEEFDE